MKKKFGKTEIITILTVASLIYGFYHLIREETVSDEVQAAIFIIAPVLLWIYVFVSGSYKRPNS